MDVFQYYRVDVASLTAVPETSDTQQNWIDSSSNDAAKDALRRRKRKSAQLLKQEQSGQQKRVTRQYLARVNRAVAILHARQLLSSLLADWPTSSHVISAKLLGCPGDAHVPFVLDMLNRDETRDTFKNVVHPSNTQKLVDQHCS